MLCQEFAIAPEMRCIAHPDAYQISDFALRNPRGRTVIIDLSKVEEITTSAFARLVLLRRQLRRCGRDLRLSGLHSRAARLYEINRLEAVLPLI